MKNKNKANRRLLYELFDDNEVKPGYSRMGMFDRPGPSINTGKTVVPELPLNVMPQMATQLSVEMPPIDDSDYYPNTKEDLALALQALAKRVPNDESRRIFNVIRKYIEKSYGQANDQKVGNMTESLRNIIRQAIRENKKNYSLSNLLFEMFDVDKDGSAYLESKDYESPFDTETSKGTSYRILSVKDFLDFLEDPDSETDEMENEDISLLDNYQEDIVEFFVNKKITHWDYDLNSRFLYGYVNPDPTPITFDLSSQNQEEAEIETPDSQKSEVPSSLTYAGYSLSPKEKRAIEILDKYVDLYSVGQEKDLIKSRLGFLKYSGVSFSSSNDVKWVWHDRKVSIDTLDSLATSLNFLKNKAFRLLGLSKKDIQGQGSESGKYIEKSNYIVYVQRFGFDQALIIKQIIGDNYIILENNEIVDMKIEGISNPLSDIQESIRVFKIQNIQNHGLTVSKSIIDRVEDKKVIGRPGYDFPATEEETYRITQIDAVKELIEKYYNESYDDDRTEIKPEDISWAPLMRSLQSKYIDLDANSMADEERVELIKNSKVSNYTQHPSKGTPTIKGVTLREIPTGIIVMLARKGNKSFELEYRNQKKYLSNLIEKFNKLVENQLDDILNETIKQLGLPISDIAINELKFDLVSMVYSKQDKFRINYYKTVQHKSAEEYKIHDIWRNKFISKVGNNENLLEPAMRAFFSAIGIFVENVVCPPLRRNKTGEVKLPADLMKVDILQNNTVRSEISFEVERIKDSLNDQVSSQPVTESYSYFDKFMIDIARKRENILNESKQRMLAENNWRIRERAAKEREHHLHTMRIKNEK